MLNLNCIPNEPDMLSNYQINDITGTFETEVEDNFDRKSYTGSEKSSSNYF